MILIYCYCESCKHHDNDHARRLQRSRRKVEQEGLNGTSQKCP